MNSKLSFENPVLRFDAEYFKKQYLIEDKNRLKYKTSYVEDNFFVTDGQHGYHEVDENSEIRHLTAKNFKNWYADDNNADRLAKWVDDNNQRSSLEVNDVVLTTRGSVGYCAIVKNDVLPANIDQDVARIAKLESSKITPQYLVTYLNSKYGQDWLKRNQTGMVQQGLALWRVKQIPIPLLSIKFQKEIEKIIEFSYTTIQKSKYSYDSAVNLFLKELGLENFAPSSEGMNIKTRSKSFDVTGRLDAEYYQPKFYDFLKKVYEYKNGFESLEIACNLKAQNFKPSDKKTYKYIELSNIGKTGDITGSTVGIGRELPSRARRKVFKDDIIVSSIEGSLESCALITSDYDGALCSTGFYVINSKKINSETLLVLFKSDLMQNLLKQNCSGTILTSINKVDFLKIPIPIIENTVQEQIKTSLEESFSLKKQSEHLLETAKKAVEMAIEENEQTALNYINRNIIMDGR